MGCGTAARQGYRCDGCRIHDREPALYDHGLDIPHALQMVRLTFDCIHGGRRADGAPGLNPHWRMTEDGLARMARAVLTGTVAATAARYRTDTRKVSELQAGLRRELAVAIAIPAELSVDDLHLIGRGTCTVITDPAIAASSPWSRGTRMRPLFPGWCASPATTPCAPWSPMVT